MTLRLALVISFVLVLAACTDDEPAMPSFVGRLTVEITGFPDSAEAPVSVTHDSGDIMAVPRTADLGLLPPGDYVFTSTPVSVGFGDYYPDALERTVHLDGGDEVTVTVAFVGLDVRGGLVLTPNGLPSTEDTMFEVTGPGDIALTLAVGDSLSALAPGEYTVDAPRTTVDDQLYVPWPESVPVSVVAGSYATVTHHYGAAHDVDLDLSIPRLEWTQATQRPDGSVPLIAGREAVLRIYGVATTINAVSPDVSVELYHDGTLLRTETVTRNEDGTPVLADPSAWQNSWNLRIPADDVVPGLGARVTIDPDDVVLETLEANNRHPDLGLAEPPVIERPTIAMRLVPVYQTRNELLGDATEANRRDWVSEARLLLPTPEVDVDLHPVVSTNASPLDPENAGNGWVQILTEINVMRIAEVHEDRHYFGAVKVSYTSGIAGLGQMPGFTAIGWDYDGSREGVLAHELGHNLGLAHADCGGPAGVDPAYPYPMGQIGTWGLDVDNEIPMHPFDTFDLMSYCQPKWISDYMFEKVVALNPVEESAAPPAATECLLVWGYRTENELVLEPALTVITVPVTPTDPGPFRIAVRDADGADLVATSFEMTDIADLPAGNGTFCWAFPLPRDKSRRAERIELRGPNGLVVHEAQHDKVLAAPSLRRDVDLEVRWDGGAAPLVMARRARDGAVIGLLRHGEGTLLTDPGPLDLVVSDGVRSRLIRVNAP